MTSKTDGQVKNHYYSTYLAACFCTICHPTIKEIFCYFSQQLRGAREWKQKSLKLQPFVAVSVQAKGGGGHTGFFRISGLIWELGRSPAFLTSDFQTAIMASWKSFWIWPKQIFTYENKTSVNLCWIMAAVTCD